MKITAMPYDPVLRAGRASRSVVLTVVEDSGQSYSRRIYDDMKCEDYINSKRVPHVSGLMPDRLLADAWGWIEDKAKKYLSTGTEAARRELAGVARWL
ncbi:hypothetical protein ACMHYO_11635 [Allopusillimonas ginsengisoli]|uniref:hypothetical protein n=1 Tax=Allopusillimonas ginsengisoli TaxID=453575 RepID=UPI0039C31FCD